MGIQLALNGGDFSSLDWQSALQSFVVGAAWSGIGAGALRNAVWKGGEVVWPKGALIERIAPFGHRVKNLAKEWFRRLPHYHRRGPGGIGRHRPWESGPGGFLGRFALFPLLCP